MDLHPRYLAAGTRAAARLHKLIQTTEPDLAHDGNESARYGRYYEMLAEELHTEFETLEQAAIVARVYGCIGSLDEYQALHAQVSDPENYRTVWTEFWAPLFDSLDDDDQLRYRPDPAVAAAQRFLQEIVDLEHTSFADPYRYVQTVDGLASQAADALAGAVDFDQVQRELGDYATLLDSASTVYRHVTSGRISKPFTLPSSVCAEADEIQTEAIAPVQAAAVPFLEERALLEEAGDLPVAVDARLLLQLLDAVEAL